MSGPLMFNSGAGVTLSRDDNPLSHWRACDLSPRALGAVVARPQFTEAARALYRGKLDTAAQDPVMAGLFRDVGHYVIALWAFSLSRDGGDITLPRLKAVCARSRLMSPGRTRALLGYLQHVGYLSRVAPRVGQAAAVYAPTPRFVESWCRHMRCGLQAAAILEPAAQTLLERMDDPATGPGLALAFAQIQGEIILAGVSSFDDDALHDLPFMRIFSHRLGGGRVMSLLLSRDEGPEPIGTASVQVTIEEVVRSAGISRLQARRLFEDAVSEGLVRIEDGRLTWLEGARGHINFTAAFEFSSLLASGAAALG